MKEKETAIRVTAVKKCYRLGAIGGKTLQEDIQSWWAKKRGREDPNLRIGADERQIGKRFWALNGVDITIYRGERIGIIGNNGAGKSTLLKLLSRITAPTEGEIEIWGRISSLLEIGTGFHREMTGRENIYMNGAILGMSRSEIESKIDRIIEFSEIGDFIDTPVKRYSSGMYVKLAFSVAAHLDSEILVMDEVLAVGDMEFQRKCLDRMRQAADEEGRTVLYVSHNMDTIRRMCSRCIVLNQGRIIFDGDVEQAIAVYMRHNMDDDPTETDLRGKAVDTSQLLSLERVRLCGKAEALYSNNEPLHLCLMLEVFRPLEALTLRLTFHTESDVTIGTAWSEPVSFAEKGRYEADFVMPTDMLAKGRFYVSIGIYRTDELGRKLKMALVPRAFRIEIEGLPVWKTSEQGYVKLPMIAVESLSQCR